LALQIATEVGESFVDGVSFVPLAPIRDASEVMPTIAQTLGFGEVTYTPAFEQLKGYLRDKSLLLLLDNFEQVVGAAPLLVELLLACPALKLLVTSRTVLRVRLERELAVAPLVLPDLAKRASPHADLEVLSRSAAVQLFLQRAQAIKPDFTITEANARTIAEICVHLDGLPLSIELAAARIRLLSPRELLTRLSHRLDMLTGGARDLPERQRTLRNTIKWSYDLLSTEEQQLFRRLAVFAGGCTLAAAEAVVPAAGPLELSVLDGLTSLLDNHLLQRKDVVGGESRLMMLETIREYALRCLETSGEAEATRHAHADYYVALLDESNHELGQRNDPTWLSLLEREHNNLRAALGCLTEREEAENALRLACALRPFWEAHGYISEGRQWLERALSASSRAPAAIRAKALHCAGELAYMQGAYRRTEALCRESIALFQDLGDRRSIAINLTTLAGVERSRGCYAEASSLREASLAMYRELEDPEGMTCSVILLASVLTYQGKYARASMMVEEGLAKAREWGYKDSIGDALNIAATIAFFQGHYASARSLIEENLAHHRASEDQRGCAYDLSFLGQILLVSEHDYEGSRALVEEALALFKELGDRRAIAKAHYRLGCVAFARGDLIEAQALYRQCLAILWEVEDTWLIAASLEKLARVALAQEQAAWAAQLCGAAEVLREVTGATRPPIERADYEYTIAAARTQLGEKTFAATLAEGRTMTPQQAFAAQELAAGQQARTMRKSAIRLLPMHLPGLTAREVDVLRLVAEGLTDIQVAEQLVLSPRTVSTHLRSIYSKLGINSRTAAARFALENRLV
jgi:predicted ATPase/DNA-binding CsgD family transcriptional regulator